MHAGGAEEPRSRADGDALGDQPEPDGREEHDAPDDEGDGAQDDPLIMMGRRVEQLEATLLTFQTVLQGLMEQTDSVMDRLHEVEGKLLPAGPTEQRRPQVPPGVPVVHLGDDGAGGCGGPSAMGGRPLFGQPGTVEPPGLTPMTTMSQMQSPQYDDVRAAWDALKNLTLNKLEYNGRRSRAEQFNTWKDLVALQVQSLGRAGLRVWGEIWTKVDEAYQRHLSTPYMERSLVKVVNAGVVSHPDLEGRLRPLLMQAVPENFKRGLLMRGTITCAEILLDLMVDAAPGSMDDRRSLQQNLTQVRVATSHRDAMHVLETWSSNMKRAKQMQVEMPDSGIMLHALKGCVAKVVEKQKEMEYRMQLYLYQHNLPQETSREKVEDFAAYLWSEMRNNDVYDLGQYQNPGARVAGAGDGKRCWGCGKTGHGKKDCPEKANQTPPPAPHATPRRCRFFLKEAGCAKGGECTFGHDQTALAQGACRNCGATGHKTAACTRPKKAQAQNSGAAAAKAAAAPSDQEVEARTASARMARAVDAQDDLILLDSGATHFVQKLQRGQPIPQNAIECKLRLAVGSVRAWKVGCEVWVGSKAQVSTLVPMGRCIASGCWLKWSRDSCRLHLPRGRAMHVSVINGEPWIRRADMDELITICNGGDDGKPGARVAEDGPGGDHQEPDDEQEPPSLAEHRRCGHHPKRGDCPVCQIASVRRRPHTKLNPLTRAGGELSVDISGPHVSAHLPGDRAAKPRGKYFLICSYTPLREDERQACLDGARAKERWVTLQGKECGQGGEPDPGPGGEVPSHGEPGGEDDEAKAVDDKGKPRSWLYVRTLTSKAAAETSVGIKTVVDEINHSFRTQAVWSLHSDMGKEFLAQSVRAVALERGLHVTRGPGYDPDSNSRAERAIGILKDAARRLLLDAGLSSEWWAYAITHAAVLNRLRDQGRRVPSDWPVFGSLVTALERVRPRDDFAARGYVGRFLGVDLNIPLGNGKYAGFVEHPNGRVESNGTFRTMTTDDKDLPGAPAETAEVEDGFTCPACRGRFAPHTRKRGECKRAPDEAAEHDSEEEDAWFLGKDEDDEEEFGLPDPTGFLKDGEMRADMMDEEEAARPKEAPDTAPWFLEVCCSGESKLADEFQIKGWRVTRFTEDMPLEGEMAKKIFKEAAVQARAGGLVFVWWSLPCTAWTRWAVLNLKKGEATRNKIEARRTESLTLQEYFATYNADISAAGGYVAFEWPRHCSGWTECPRVMEFAGRADVSWGDFDGCMLGLRATSGMHILKPWRVVTTIPGLAEDLATRRCDKSHAHEAAAGNETKRTGFYPKEMAEFIVTSVVNHLQTARNSAMAAQAQEADDVDKLEEVPDLQLQEEIRRSGLDLVTVREIMVTTGSEREQWIEAMGSELNSMKELGVLEDRSEADIKVKPRDILPAKLVCGRKPADEKGYRKKKVRMVACGNFSNQYRGEVKTHAMDATMVRVFFVYAELRGWHARTVDIDTAFLRAEFPEDFPLEYILRPPAVLTKLGLVIPGTVWKALRPIYGLRESPRCWGITRDRVLSQLQIPGGMRLRRSPADHSLWSVVLTKDGVETVVGLLGTYVDDFLMVGPPEVLDAVTSAIEQTWKLKRGGEIRPDVPGKMEFLGMTFERDQELKLVGHQQAYIDDLLNRWGMADANPTKLTGTPDTFASQGAREKRKQEDKRSDEELGDIRKRAQAVLGGLLWLSTRTRPDLAYQVGHAATLVSAYPDEALMEAKTMLRFLVGSRGYVMQLTPRPGEPSEHLTMWSDASFAPTGGKSPTGVLMQWGGSTIAWRASRTQLVAQSVAEAELVAIQEGHLLAAGVREVMISLGITLDKIAIFTDNAAALALAHEGASWRTRHFAVKAQGLREQIEIGQCKLKHVAGTEQKADGLTKSLPRMLLEKFLVALGMRPSGQSLQSNSCTAA